MIDRASLVPERIHSALRMLEAGRLSDETGITVAQANDLIDLIGHDRGSLLREARIMKKRQ